MSEIVAFIVNDEPRGAIGVRADHFATHLSQEFDVHLRYLTGGKTRAFADFAWFLFRKSFALTYVFDMSASGVLAALLYKAASGTPVIIDTGDVISALADSIGRDPIRYGLTVALEEASLRWADHLVVRGTIHRRLLGHQGHHNVTVVQDGVDTNQFHPEDGVDVRASLGIDDEIVVGTLGSAVWNENLQTCYGWELIEVIHRLRDRPVHGIMIGDGSGIPRMRTQAEEWGIEDRVHFLGYVPYEDLPAYLNAMDIALSKQTNDVVGQVRTTGKLPLYMACGLYVLATEVGEARYVLPDSMLIPFEGTDDPSFTNRLTTRVLDLIDHRSELRRGRENHRRAAQKFDYEVLSERLARLLRQFG